MKWRFFIKELNPLNTEIFTVDNILKLDENLSQFNENENSLSDEFYNKKLDRITLILGNKKNSVKGFKLTFDKNIGEYCVDIPKFSTIQDWKIAIEFIYKLSLNLKNPIITACEDKICTIKNIRIFPFTDIITREFEELKEIFELSHSNETMVYSTLKKPISLNKAIFTSFLKTPQPIVEFSDFITYVMTQKKDNDESGKLIKEKCVENLKETIEAIAHGANRIELCDNLHVGGTTPSYGTIKKVLEKADIPVFVMIRPRGGNFIYNHDEIEIMKEDILLCKSLGVDGVVLGVLNSNNEIDYSATKLLINMAKPMEVTFHKAIDEVATPLLEIKKLADIGIDRILTSGKCETALEGKELLNKMIYEAEKYNIKIVVAGKVTKGNFDEIIQFIPNNEYHGKNIV